MLINEQVLKIQITEKIQLIMPGKHREASSNSSSTTLDSESQDENKSSNEQQSEYFQCKQSCSAIQKFFSSNEALDLHNQYFHPQVGNKPSENEKQ